VRQKKRKRSRVQERSAGLCGGAVSNATTMLEQSFREVADWVHAHGRLPSQRTEKAFYLRVYKWQKGTVELPAHLRREMEIWTLEHSFREVADWVDEHKRLPSQRTEKAFHTRLYKWQKGTVVLPPHLRQEMDG
jgi:hypothetical protein